MTVQLSGELEAAIRRLAHDQQREVESLVTEAVRAYLEAASITDVEPRDVAAVQESLMPELGGVPPYHDTSEADRDAAG